MNVTYRDVGRIAGYVLPLAMYATPVIYPLTAISERNRWILGMNPMTGYIEAFPDWPVRFSD